MGKTTLLATAICSALFAAVLGSTSCSVSETLPTGGDGGSGNTGPDPTVVCEEQCVPQHVAGEADYRLLRECTLCGACADACLDNATAVCVNGAVESPSTCSEISGQDCAACVASPCTLEQLGDLTFTGVCAQFGQACAINTECVLLNGCVADCVAAGGMGGGGVGGMGMGGMAVGGN